MFRAGCVHGRWLSASLSSAPLAARLSVRNPAVCRLHTRNGRAIDFVGRNDWLSTQSKSADLNADAQVSTLFNGLRIATVAVPGAETAAVGVWIDAGSRHEDERTNGAAHFLEHMFFKGSRRRTQAVLEAEAEDMGAQLNAYTSREQSAYYARVFRSDVARMVETLGEMLLNPRLDPDAIERERSVILREQHEVEQQMDEVVFDHLHAVAFQGTSLGRTILGPAANIRSLGRADLDAFVRTHYAAPRMVLVGAGAVSHAELADTASRVFDRLPTLPEYAKTSPKDTPRPLTPEDYLRMQNTWRGEAARYVGAEVRMRNDAMPAAHIAIGVQGAPWTSPDYFPLLVAQAIVGSWNRGVAGGTAAGSRLARAAAEHNLATSFASFNTAYSDAALFGVYAVSDRRHDLDDLVYEIQQEWTRICLSATDADVARARAQLKASVLLGLDSHTAMADDIGRQMLAYGRHAGWPDVHALIDAVDAATVRRVASEYLYDRDPAVVALGPIGSVPDYARIRAATLWLRN